MRTQLLCALALAVAATAGSASAQDSESINVTSNVTPRCASLTSPGAPLALNSLVDTNGQLVTAFASSTTSVSLGNYWCNAPATVEVTASPLTNVQTVYDTGSFTNRVDYTATIDWDDFDHTKSSASAAEVFDADQANIGPLVVSVAGPVVDSNKRPIAGDYTGSVTLTVALQP